MTLKTARIGETVLVHEYTAGFDALPPYEKSWNNFHGVYVRNREHVIIVDVRNSDELTRRQKTACAGRIAVNKKFVDEKVLKSEPVQAEPFVRRDPEKVAKAKQEARDEKYRRLGDQLRALANRGYTMAQASHELGIGASLLAAARRGRDIDTRPHFHLQWLKPDGSIEYIAKIDTARKRHIVKYAFQGEEKNEWGIFHSGNWFEAEDGTIKPSESTEASNAWRR
ncbi:hypothetical protein ACFQ41_04725 [Lacticaseibacillus suilingensis]|uniref:Uncharacterized protein n=1 Tax=Lacticaseibacillus suilingensis TaxID=2799577 RepID=A0ABW4BGG6_9LACO|nr:hypothetical protein [Lacticaseibacillus suilingensis]